MKKIVILSIFLQLSISMSAQNIEGFVCRQMQAYPKSRLLDIYKSCFQDYMGAEHLVADKQSVKTYLNKELSSTNFEDLPSWYYESCGIDGNFIRVNLRMVKEGIITEDALLDVFIRSANRRSNEHFQNTMEDSRALTDDADDNAMIRPSVESWSRRWHEIMAVIDRMQLNLPSFQQDSMYIDSILSAGKYAISHSPEYREAYHPHYRIVARDIFEKEIKPQIHKAMIIRIAEIEVFPEYLTEYMTGARNVGSESVRHEPGVVCILPMQMKEDSCQIRIIEIYRSQTAYESHLKTPHFQTYKQGTLHMVKSLKLHDQVPLDAASMNLIFEKMK